MSSPDRIVVVVDRDPLDSDTGQWARVLGVLDYDEITINWSRSPNRVQEDTTRRWWEWNLVVCRLDSLRREAIPLILCDNIHLGQVVGSFVSVSAAHIRNGGFVRLGSSKPKVDQVGLDDWDDAIHEALGDANSTLSLVQVGQAVAAVRCHCLRIILSGRAASSVAIQSAVKRLLASKTSAKSIDCLQNRKRKMVEYSERNKEQRARLLEFIRIKNCKTYSSKVLTTGAVVTPFAARTFVRSLDQFYGGKEGHPGYMRTVARYADGLPPWDRVFSEEWQSLGIKTQPPPLGEKMVLLQYPNANGMGYSFAVCNALGVQQLISSTENPTFSEVFRDDLVLTAIPIDWDMPVSEVSGPKWYPETWLRRIQNAAEAALRQLLPILKASRPTGRFLRCHMWISEEMKAAMATDGSVLVRGLDKVTCHANLLLPHNVILDNYKVLTTLYEMMERLDKSSSSKAWHLDKSITKLRLSGCLKLLEDGSYVRRLVPWGNMPSGAYEALVHAKHDVPPLDGVDMAIIRTPSFQNTFCDQQDEDDLTEFKKEDMPFDEAVQIIRQTLSKTLETATLELATAPRPPFIGVRKRTDGNNWCIIKGGPHRRATMYFVVGRHEKVWIHCYSDRCKSKRDKTKHKPYIDLSTSQICWNGSSLLSGKSF